MQDFFIYIKNLYIPDLRQYFFQSQGIGASLDPGTDNADDLGVLSCQVPGGHGGYRSGSCLRDPAAVHDGQGFTGLGII